MHNLKIGRARTNVHKLARARTNQAPVMPQKWPTDSRLSKATDDMPNKNQQNGKRRSVANESSIKHTLEGMQNPLFSNLFLSRMYVVLE